MSTQDKSLEDTLGIEQHDVLDRKIDRAWAASGP